MNATERAEQIVAEVLNELKEEVRKNREKWLDILSVDPDALGEEFLDRVREKVRIVSVPDKVTINVTVTRKYRNPVTNSLKESLKGEEEKKDATSYLNREHLEEIETALKNVLFTWSDIDEKLHRALIETIKKYVEVEVEEEEAYDYPELESYFVLYTKEELYRELGLEGA